MKLQITPSSKCSVVRVGHIFAHTISINLSIGRKNVCSLGTVLSTKVTSVFTFRQIVFTFLVMLCSMRLSSRFPRSHHPPILPSPSCTLFQFCLINLWMLHILLCCCLTMVQGLDEALDLSFWMMIRPQLRQLLLRRARRSTRLPPPLLCLTPTSITRACPMHVASMGRPRHLV